MHIMCGADKFRHVAGCMLNTISLPQHASRAAAGAAARQEKKAVQTGSAADNQWAALKPRLAPKGSVPDWTPAVAAQVCTEGLRALHAA